MRLRRDLVVLACVWAAAALAVLGEGAAFAQTPSGLVSERLLAERPHLMVLGTPHLANHNRDVNNAHADDMLTPRRQAEIARLVEALAAWKPTRIAVEWTSSAQGKLDARYADYRAGRYVLSADEIDQIGLRLAARLGLPRLEAVNWNEMPPGVEDDYDWEKGAADAHDEARLAALRAPRQSQAQTEMIRTHTVAGFLRAMNRPVALAAANRRYYDFALLGTAEKNQGANWVGAWHGRNLKIFADLVRLNARPEERILVIFGAGHAHLLNLLAQDSGAFRLERPDALLARAGG